MFRKLTDTVYASPHIGLDEIAEAKALGVALIVNNRPEGESDDQTLVRRSKPRRRRRGSPTSRFR